MPHLVLMFIFSGYKSVIDRTNQQWG